MHNDGCRVYATVQPQRHDPHRVRSHPPQRRREHGRVVDERLPGRNLQHPSEHHGSHMTGSDRRRGRHGLLFAGVAVAALAIAGVAFAFWAATDASNPARAVADSIQAGNMPTLGGVSAQDVTLNWTATTSASGASVTGYTINRYSVSSGGTPTAATGGCSGTVSALSCTEQSVPVGTWYYAVTPRIALWSGAESGRVPVTVTATVGAPSPTS